MPATRTTTTLASGITQATVVTALLAAFSSAGYSAPYDNYTSGTDQILVYEFVYDSTKTYGKVYYKIRITSALIIVYQICSAWNTTSKVASNAPAEAALITLANTSTISFDALNGGSEYKFVVITQLGTSAILGIICPANKPDWWNVNTFPYGLVFNSTSLSNFTSCSLNPYSSNLYTSFFNATNFGLPNQQTNKRDVITEMVIISSSNRGVAGKTSSDIGMGACNGSGKFDLLTFPGSSLEYLVINNTPGGLVIRTA